MKHSDGILQEEVVNLIPALRAFARTFYRSPADADDLVQETLVRALGNIEQFKQGTRMKSWLFTIMRNAFCTRFRLRQREPLGAEECVSLGGSVPADQEWHLRGHELEAACGRLPEPYRAAFAYIFVDGRSYEEAAVHFHCPIGTIKSRVNRARQRIAHDIGYYQ
ncbi:RNA polymerase sigma-70 factor (ECF subfamily) [Rhizobium sp. BK529]|uniref:sigma-70 family RNA polymerase sigma factor n=1 Tax=Rhizobium sp. BK529 TaxID=2586983 RepID=UPI00161D3D43|nr:sigma-70 family RNA polymerase sigma factor [Rhizobium sp. BK529]MBB3590921.1 RNA polymerase sigma-70 factor (ECF subfamily) [Rhizobium sp. BK529]